MDKLHSWRKTLFDPLAWWLSKRELRKLMCGSSDIEDVFEITDKYIGRGYYARIHAVQHRDEIIELVRLVQNLEPKTVVELGTDKGGTFFLWCRLLKKINKIASIDLPDGRFGGGYHNRRIKLYMHFLFDNPNISALFLRNDSHDPTTKDALIKWLKLDKIDFLYIDGDHTYSGVKQDFEMYSALVRPGGIIAFHDIRTKGNGHEVYKYWNDLKENFKYSEITQNPSGSMGIGIIRVADE